MIDIKWQDVRDLGLGLFKKRNRSRTLWVGGGTSIFAFFAYILLLTGVSETNSGDSDCIYNETLGLDRCEAYVNITTSYWRFCFDKEFKFIDTNPKIDTELYVPTYGRKWRVFNPAKDCINRKKINKFKIVGYKEFEQTVKWSFAFNQFNGRINIDPIWHGINITKICDWRTDKIPVYDYFNYTYTCSTGVYKLNQAAKYAWCYESIWYPDNSTWQNKTIFQRRYDKLIPPDTVGWRTLNQTGTNYVDVCENIVGYQLNQYKVNFSLCNMYCARENKIVSCDSTIDGNGDGVLDSGESGFSFDITKVNWRKFKIKVDSVKYTKLRDCVVKV